MRTFQRSPLGYAQHPVATADPLRRTHRCLTAALASLEGRQKLFHAMPNTGSFHLHEVLGTTEGTPEHFTSITAVRATCQKCRRTMHATSPPELESIEGGTILACAGCGARQAISNARFDLFVGRDRSRASDPPG